MTTPRPAATRRSARPINKAVLRAFWATIVAMACVTIGLALAAVLRAPESEKLPRELPSTVLERLFSEAARKARAELTHRIDDVLYEAYSPVYAAVPAYASFHYSILGEYTELGRAALGEMSATLGGQLFAGFEDRLRREAAVLDRVFAAAYRKAIEDAIAEAVPTASAKPLLGPMTKAVINDAIDRAQITVPLASVATTAAGSGALKAATTAMAKKIGARVAIKAAAKGAAKGGGVLTGAGGGALACSWSGPVAVLCGVLGGAAAWLITDAAIVNIDEFFNRDEFEADLRRLIDQDRAEKKRLLEDALKAKAAEMDAAAKDFMLNELADRPPDQRR